MNVWKNVFFNIYVVNKDAVPFWKVLCISCVLHMLLSNNLCLEVIFSEEIDKTKQKWFIMLAHVKREVILTLKPVINMFRNLKMNERLCLWTLFTIKHAWFMCWYECICYTKHNHTDLHYVPERWTIFKCIKVGNIILYKLSMSQQKWIYLHTHRARIMQWQETGSRCFLSLKLWKNWSSRA